jgi:hypothetical protein
MKLSKIKIFLLLAVALSAAFCTNDALDDGSAPDVYLLIEEVKNDPVTASVDEETGVCTFIVNEWEVSLRNEPVNTFGGSEPFQSVVMLSAELVYDWVGTGLTTPDHISVGLGSVAIPAEGTSKVTFFPVYFQDLTISHAGNFADMTVTLHGVTVEGTAITKVFSVQLVIEGCA